MNPTADSGTAIRSWSASGSSAAQALAVFDPDLAIFAGHFPDRPVVPGVHLLAVVAEVVRRALNRPTAQIIEIMRSKWTLPLGPGEQCAVNVAWNVLADHVEVDGRIVRDSVAICLCELKLR